MVKLITRNIRLLGFGGVALVAIAAQPALAATASANLGVSATVTSDCSVSTSAVAFGNVDVTTGDAVDATGGLSVTCTNGTAWSASADAGAGSGATLAVRKMTSGTDLLSYALYVDSGRTSAWGDGAATATIDGTGNGSLQSSTVYGRVFGGQNSSVVGSYADTVAVTVTY